MCEEETELIPYGTLWLKVMAINWTMQDSLSMNGKSKSAIRFKCVHTRFVFTATMKLDRKHEQRRKSFEKCMQ